MKGASASSYLVSPLIPPRTAHADADLEASRSGGSGFHAHLVEEDYADPEAQSGGGRWKRALIVLASAVPALGLCGGGLAALARDHLVEGASLMTGGAAIAWGCGVAAGYWLDNLYPVRGDERRYTEIGPLGAAIGGL